MWESNDPIIIDRALFDIELAGQAAAAGPVRTTQKPEE